jgi:hypothetical protein
MGEIPYLAIGIATVWLAMLLLAFAALGVLTLLIVRHAPKPVAGKTELRGVISYFGRDRLPRKDGSGSAPVIKNQWGISWWMGLTGRSESTWFLGFMRLHHLEKVIAVLPPANPTREGG